MAQFIEPPENSMRAQTDTLSSDGSISSPFGLQRWHATSAIARTVVIIHPSRLFRDCLRRALVVGVGLPVIDFDDAEPAMATLESPHMGLLLIGFNQSQAGVDQLDAIIAKVAGRAPVVVTGQSEDPKAVAALLAKGVSGYVPSSLDLEVTIQALGLVLAGGTYAPAGYLTRLWQTIHNRPAETTPETLTSKQLAVIEAIRKGKPNKTIAYELNMCESTVKVHIRNIMKKLQARNRTQVAYIANQMLVSDDKSSVYSDGRAQTA